MKKIASINDLSGIGRCSLSVSIPIISSLKVQCCPFPTAILSSQTGYPEFTFVNLTSNMDAYSKVWHNLGVNFDCICSGFLGSKDQVHIVSNFILNNSDSLIVVDPVFGDDGSLYPTFDEDMCFKIKDLVKLADITTPNLTEACFLTNRDLSKNTYSKSELISIAKDVSDLGPSKVIITGIVNFENDTISNLAYDRALDEVFFTSTKYNHCSYSGTGDIFCSIISAMLVRGFDLKFSTTTASNFISKVVEYTSMFDHDKNDGVLFENFLGDLTII